MKSKFNGKIGKRRSASRAAGKGDDTKQGNPIVARSTGKRDDTEQESSTIAHPFRKRDDTKQENPIIACSPGKRDDTEQENSIIAHPLGKRDGTEREGLIIAHFGAVVDVEDGAGRLVRCHLRKNQEPVITGDRILWRLEQEGVGTVVGSLPRKSLLLRPGTTRRTTKLIAANVDAIVIVTAPPPNFSSYLLDCYLVAAESMQVQPIILLNKIDLLDEAACEPVKSSLDNYAKIGYPVIYSSVFTRDGLSELEGILQNKVGVLVGASGVGKSSLIAALTDANDIRVGEVSAAKQGKHTTTTTRFYRLSGGGGVIDSPGVREFSLWHMEPGQIIQGFIEFRPFIGSCKFRNCHHGPEPGCALQLAVAENKIAPERWKSYLAIIQMADRDG